MDIGTKIYASRGGIVVMTKDDGYRSGPNRGFAEEANHITIKHEDGTYGKYVHLKLNGVAVKIGDIVNRGDFLGYSGNTGFTNGPHLHFVVFTGKDSKSRTSIPIKFIAQSGFVIVPIVGNRYTAVK
jgi:murein DD-endopeptidase MepM/ murein hydrolase activator NlpD